MKKGVNLVFKVLLFSKISAQCPPEESYSPCNCYDNDFDDGALKIDCDSRDLDDQKASDILDNIIANLGSSSPLRALRMENNQLTKVPDQIKLLPALQQLYLYQNDIEVITAGSLTFDSAEDLVGLGTKIKTIEPGAFVGINNL